MGRRIFQSAILFAFITLIIPPLLYAEIFPEIFEIKADGCIVGENGSSCPETNLNPVFDPLSSQQILKDSSIQIPIGVSDPEGDTLSLTAEGECFKEMKVLFDRPGRLEAVITLIDPKKAWIQDDVLQLSAKDSAGNETVALIPIKIILSGIDHPIELNVGNTMRANQMSQLLVIALSAKDADGSQLYLETVAIPDSAQPMVRFFQEQNSPGLISGKIYFDPSVIRESLKPKIRIRVTDGNESTASVEISAFIYDKLENVPPGIFKEPHIFSRGCINSDSSIDLSDAVAILSYLFLGEQNTGCRDALDTNDDGKIDLTDAIVILRYLFVDGAPLAFPSQDAFFDITSNDSFPTCNAPLGLKEILGDATSVPIVDNIEKCATSPCVVKYYSSYFVVTFNHTQETPAKESWEIQLSDLSGKIISDCKTTITYNPNGTFTLEADVLRNENPLGLSPIPQTTWRLDNQPIPRDMSGNLIRMTSDDALAMGFLLGVTEGQGGVDASDRIGPDPITGPELGDPGTGNQQFPRQPDGCSGPVMAAGPFPVPFPGTLAPETNQCLEDCCNEHDACYACGGTEEDRKECDEALRQCWDGCMGNVGRIWRGIALAFMSRSAFRYHVSSCCCYVEDMGKAVDLNEATVLQDCPGSPPPNCACDMNCTLSVSFKNGASNVPQEFDCKSTHNCRP